MKKKISLKPKTKSADLMTLCPAKCDDVFSRFRPDGGVVIVKIACDSHFFQLDNVAAEFWSLIDGKKTVRSISSVLSKKHAALAHTIDKEINRLMSDLMEHELVKN